MRRVQSVILLLAVTLVAVCQSSRSASADVMAYASTNQGDFGRINLTTGQYTSIGSLGLPSTTIYGMGFIGVTLYGADDDSLAAGFYSIDTTTGLATSITTLGDTVYGGTTGFGAFYAVDSYSPGLLFAVDTSGTFLGLSPLAFTADGLIAFGPGPNLYVSGIGVARQYRGQGLAKSLSSELIRELRRLKFNYRLGRTDINAISMRKLYVKQGFQELSVHDLTYPSRSYWLLSL